MSDPTLAEHWLQQNLATALALLETLLEAFDGPCVLDHDGACQAHLLEQECSVAAGRTFLASMQGTAN